MMAWTPNWTRLTSAAELALDRTLTCGQSFTWTRLPSGIWYNTLRLPGHAVPVLLRTHNDEVQFRSFGSPRSQAQFQQPVPKTPLPPTQYLVAPSRDPAAVVAPSHDPVYLLLHDYFQLSYSLPALYLDWSTRDPSHFAHVSPLVPGIRLLRQPPVETLFAFICSANNNIARITGMVQALAMRYGECVYPGGLLDIGGEEQALPPMYVFPSMDRLVQSADEIEGVLRGLGFGYRAKYIAATVKTLGGLGGEAWLVGLRGKGYAEVRDALVQLQGVGRKVADCVALMSLDQPGAIPVDTHVWQIATRDYKFKPSTKSKSLTPTTYDEVVKLFQTLFGPEAGWAHSVRSIACFFIITRCAAFSLTREHRSCSRPTWRATLATRNPNPRLPQLRQDPQPLPISQVNPRLFQNQRPHQRRHQRENARPQQQRRRQFG
ncbi:DNA glycosylase [Catenaria anguillulae PL171]|uniref:DNA-(apurinic or apyrimidinic site) lyase n=1 Tax=Catenaria anguillulae PL171 TaxID=765915 RepID=A0A1Y2I2E6_9FUNG|nr:DNA glycosylase [Catenaria anguillulae PL171]